MDRVESVQRGNERIGDSRVLAAVASSAFVLTGVVNTFLGPILPSLATRWHLSDVRSGYFFTAQFLGSMLGVSLSSLLLPRRGFRFCISLAYGLMALGVCALESPAWKLALGGVFVFGLGLGGVIPTSNLLISGMYQDRRAGALSILNFCWGIGAVISPLVIAFAERQNHASAFVPALGVLLLLAAAGVALTSEEEQSVANQPGELGEEGITHWAFPAIVGGMFFLYVGTEASIGGWIATLAERASAEGIQRGAAAASFFWGGLLVGRGVAPLFLARMRERNLAIASLVIALAGSSILVVVPVPIWIIIAGAVTGCGLAAVFPITIAVLSRFRHRETTIAGPMFALAGLGGAVMPFLVGFISSRHGSLRAGLMLPLLAIISLLLLHLIENKVSVTKVTPT